MKGKISVILLSALLLLAAGCKDDEAAVSEEAQVETIVTPVKTAAPEETAEPKSDEDHEEKAVVVTGPAELICALPKDFEESGDEAGLFIHKSFPDDISTISHVIAEGGENIAELPQEEFLARLEKDYLDSYGDDITIEFSQYEKINVDGRPGISVKMNFEFKAISFEQLITMLYNGDESHIITYTQEAGNKWMEAFEKSVASIEFRELESE